jgi:hypothetical protein
LEAEGVLQFPDDIAHQEKPIVLLSSMRAAWKQLNWPPADLPLSCYRYSSRSSTQKGADSHGDRTEFSPPPVSPHYDASRANLNLFELLSAGLVH